MPVHAYEDQASLGVSLGYAHAVFHGQPENGAIVSADGSIGLDDIWSLRASLGFGFHPDENRQLSVFLADAELIYMVDVFELVPYFGAGVDGIGTLRSAAFAADFGVHPVFGIDWLPRRNLVLGFCARPIFLITALDRDPVYLTLSVSASLLFDL